MQLPEHGCRWGNAGDIGYWSRIAWDASCRGKGRCDKTKMGCWPGQAEEEGPLLRVPFCLAGTAPICWCLHCLCHPQLLPPSLGIAGCDHGTVVLGQQHLQCPLDPHPLCRWGAAGLSVAIHIWTGLLSPVSFPSTAGEWRWPLLTPRALAVGIAMAISCSTNSVGCYVLCGRLLRVPRLPPHACNRGLCMEGLGSLLAGLLGTPGGTASSIANTCATGLTQVCQSRGKWVGKGWGGS